MNEQPPTRLSELHRQQSAGFLTLRFGAALESEFRTDHLDSIATRRMVLIVAAIVLIGGMPLADALLLHPPEAFIPLERWSQFAFMVPATVLAGICTGVRALRRWSDLTLLAGAVIVCSGVMYQRHVGAALGFNVPSEFTAVVLTGTAVLAGLRAVHFLVAALLIFGISGWNEVLTFGDTHRTTYIILSQGMMTILVVLGAAINDYYTRAAWLQRKMLEELTLRDPLTGLVNARGLHDVYERVFATATREHRPLVVSAIDIDHFKAYNDHYGHLAGDDCLRRVAHALSRHGRRGTDIAARTGGEEFVVVWYDVVPDHVVRLLETMREDVERLGILHAGIPDKPGVVTISIGAICAVPGPRLDPSALLKIADEQLYLSKRRGRNCVSVQITGAERGSDDPLSLRGLRPS